MIKISRISRADIRIEENETSPRTRVLSLAYTYAGDKEEVAGLLRLANWWARLGKTRLAQSLAQLAHDLEEGIVMGVIAPGDTVYCAV